MSDRKASSFKAAIWQSNPHMRKASNKQNRNISRNQKLMQGRYVMEERSNVHIPHGFELKTGLHFSHQLVTKAFEMQDKFQKHLNTRGSHLGCENKFSILQMEDSLCIQVSDSINKDPVLVKESKKNVRKTCKNKVKKYKRIKNTYLPGVHLHYPQSYWPL